MMCTQVPGGNKAYIVAGYFWSGLEPFKDVVGDGIGDAVGLAIGRACTEGCRDNTLVKFCFIKAFGWSLAFALYDVNMCVIAH